MRTDQDIKTFLAMQRFGGSFAQKLGEAAEQADDQNLARIKSAWPEMWAEYTDLARLSEASLHPAQDIS